MAGSIIKLDTIRTALAKAATVDAVKDVRDKASAVATYAKQVGDCKGIEREATIIRLRAERRIGELLSRTVRKGSKCTPGAHLPKGITRKQSAAWQQVAKLSNKVFEKHLASPRPSTKGLVKLAIHGQRKRQRGPSSGYSIFTGDMSVLWDRLADGSVDLILTDPPYTEMDAYCNLAELAASKLRDGGICAAYSSLMYLPDVLSGMSKNLTYWWTCAMMYSGPPRAIFTRMIQGSWRPIVLFAKGKPNRPWMIDCLTGGGKTHENHHWGKPESEAEYLIRKLSDRGDLIVDPFAGSGTTLAVAKRLGRRYLGVEIDKATARGARRRIAA